MKPSTKIVLYALMIVCALVVLPDYIERGKTVSIFCMILYAICSGVLLGIAVADWRAGRE